MPTLRWLSNRYLRIDARSLGLFRWLFGIVLLADLCRRWRWLPAFYSNDGVVPNHHHLFNLRESGRVFSIYHAFSHRDEAFTAFAVTLVIYLCFTVGFHTRVFAVLSAFCLVSLAGRNILTNGVGDSLAILVAILAAFLPLGRRFSVDSLRRSFADRDEFDARDLNDRESPTIEPARGSLAALSLVLVIGLVPLAAALQQRGEAWGNGQALYYALRSDRLITAFGELVRTRVPVGALTLWTHLLRAAELAILPLALLPIGRRISRATAMGALAIVGGTYAACFELGAYGGTLVAAIALLVPEETWDGMARGTRPIRLVYDSDCGMCLWLARLVKRLDLRRNVTFVENGAVASGEVEGVPSEVTAEVVERSIVVLDAAGKAHLDADALAALLRSLPLLGWLGVLVGLPGVSVLVRRMYYRVAEKRLDISMACGLGACGVAAHDEAQPEARDVAPSDAPLPPGVRLRRGLGVGVESLLVALVMATFFAATDTNNDLSVKSGLARHDFLLGAASYTRILAPWGVFSPEPPRRNEALVAVGTMRDGGDLDVLTGAAPDLGLAVPSQHRLGPLWANYIDALRRDTALTFRQELRRYLSRGGKIADDKEQAVGTTKLRTLIVSVPIPAPGAAPEGEREEQDLLDGPSLPRGSQAPDRGFGHAPKLRDALAPIR